MFWSYDTESIFLRVQGGPDLQKIQVAQRSVLVRPSVAEHSQPVNWPTKPEPESRRTRGDPSLT